MTLQRFRRACLAGISVAMLIPVANVHAGPFEDLLFGRRNAYYYPVGNRYVPAAPVVTNYAPAGVTTYMPVAPTTAYQPTTCNQPVTAGYAPVQTVAPVVATTALAPTVANTTCYAPAPAVPTTAYAPALPGCGCGTPRTVNMYPAVPNYRTVWYRVPTTNFRPVTAYDPATCGQVTTLQPCTTYTWQARRVPASGGGFFSWLFHRRRAARTAPIYPYSACATQPVISGGTIVTTPGMTVQGGQAPADVPPSLDPGVYVPQGGASINGATTVPSVTVPSNVQPLDSDAIDTARPLIDPSTTLELDAGASHNQPAPAPLDSLEADAGVSTKSEASARRNQPNPVPDPDAMIQTQKRFAPPKLINPRDRRASTGPAPGSFVLVSWPNEVKVQPRQSSQPAPQPETPARPATQRSDAGWRSVPR